MREDAFIGALRAALGFEKGRARVRPDLFAPRAPGEAERILARARRRTHTERQALVERLEEMAAPIHLKVCRVKDLPDAAAAVGALAVGTSPEGGELKMVAAWRHPLIDLLDLPAVLGPLGIPVVAAPLPAPGSREVEAQRRLGFRRDVAAACVGVTSADCCVADSATLVMKTRPGQPRSVSLVPSVHVAVMREEGVIADLRELYALLGHDPAWRDEGLGNCMTFISGPSKTADIEAQMVHGAHGPRELHLVLVRG